MSNETKLAVIEQAGFLSPVVSVQSALIAYQAKKELIDGIMKSGVDFGVIPGSSKPTLLKAGAEKATSFFGLSPHFKDAGVVEDWTGADHDGEPFFYYRRTCELWRGDHLVASVDGSCNSWEKKYRYRSSERVCPTCGKPTIIKGKQAYGGGWLCFAKKGGCGAKFFEGDKTIEGQEVGQVKNVDIADQVNTLLKMADKRALVAATLIATGLSEYFTQDIEDYTVGEIVEGEVKTTKIQPEYINHETGEIVEPLIVESTAPAPLPNSTEELKKVFAKEFNAALKVVAKGTKLPSITPKSGPDQIKEAIEGIRAAVAANGEE